MTTGYEVKMYADISRIADALERCGTGLLRIAKALEEPPTEDPPDTSWMKDEEARLDFGRNPRGGR